MKSGCVAFCAQSDFSSPFFTKPLPPNPCDLRPYVLAYDGLIEAIRPQHDIPQGLSSAIFTESLRNAEAFLSQRGSDCGIANVNMGTSAAETRGAFGGKKETGPGASQGQTPGRPICADG